LDEMKRLILVFVFCLAFATSNLLISLDSVINIVVLGSSTAEGYGPSV
jgi:hypothetical protein